MLPLSISFKDNVKKSFKAMFYAYCFRTL